MSISPAFVELHSGPRRAPLWPRGAVWMAGLVWFVATFAPLSAGAQEPPPDEEPSFGEEGGDMLGIGNVAATLIAMTALHWDGARTKEPQPRDRPPATRRIDSELLPVAVHGSDDVSEARLRAALRALEQAVWVLEREGWELPVPDGGRGETSGFDLYLSPTDALAEGAPEGDVPWSFLDSNIGFGVVDPDVDRLGACVAQAYGETLALSLDPAEASGWRKALGVYLARRVTGEFGCGDAVDRQQAEPYRSWIPTVERLDERAPLDGGGGALLFALLSERHDGGTGRFIRDLWDLVRQRTWEQETLGLRASPDLWEGIDTVLEASGSKLDPYMDELAVARFALGDSARERHAGYAALHDLNTPVPLTFETDLAALPHHTGASPVLDVYGSAYAMVDVRGAPSDSRLRIWLRGEYGVEWQLSATRLDAEGRERGRLSAPPRVGDRRAYLPIELDEDTAQVLVTVTNLGHRLPDADDPEMSARAFRLIFELVREGQEPVRD